MFANKAPFNFIYDDNFTLTNFNFTIMKVGNCLID